MAQNIYIYIYIFFAHHPSVGTAYASVNLVVKKGDGTISAVKQGALEDSWLVSAFDILLPSEVLLRKVIVSDRHRDKGEGVELTDSQSPSVLLFSMVTWRSQCFLPGAWQ